MSQRLPADSCNFYTYIFYIVMNKKVSITVGRWPILSVVYHLLQATVPYFLRLLVTKKFYNIETPNDFVQ